MKARNWFATSVLGALALAGIAGAAWFVNSRRRRDREGEAAPSGWEAWDEAARGESRRREAEKPAPEEIVR